MKKIILSAIAVMTFAFSNAQEIKFGVKGGVNLAALTGDIDDTSSKVGFHVGGFAEFKLSEKFAIQPELLFSTQGVKFKESGEGFSSEDKLNLSYINLPIMAKFYVVPKFSIEAGPQIGFLVSAKDKYEEKTNGEKTFSSNEDVKDYYKSIDFGVNFGAGYDFTENLSVGLRYNLGLSNIAKFGDDSKLKSSVFSLSVGYKF